MRVYAKLIIILEGKKFITFVEENVTVIINYFVGSHKGPCVIWRNKVYLKATLLNSFLRTLWLKLATLTRSGAIYLEYGRISLFDRKQFYFIVTSLFKIVVVKTHELATIMIDVSIRTYLLYIVISEFGESDKVNYICDYAPAINILGNCWLIHEPAIALNIYRSIKFTWTCDDCVLNRVP